MKTEEKIKVMKAFVEGKSIEYSTDEKNWKPTNNPVWCWNTSQYRIASEKKEGWINVYTADCCGNIFSTKELADQYASFGRVACIKITYTEGEGL